MYVKPDWAVEVKTCAISTTAWILPSEIRPLKTFGLNFFKKKYLPGIVIVSFFAKYSYGNLVYSNLHKYILCGAFTGDSKLSNFGDPVNY